MAKRSGLIHIGEEAMNNKILLIWGRDPHNEYKRITRRQNALVNQERVELTSPYTIRDIDTFTVVS